MARFLAFGQTVDDKIAAAVDGSQGLDLLSNFSSHAWWLAPTDAGTAWRNRGSNGGIAELGSNASVSGSHFFDPIDTTGSNSYVTLSENPFDFSNTGESFIALSFQYAGVTSSTANPRLVRAIDSDQGIECYIEAAGTIKVIIGDGTTVSFTSTTSIQTDTDYIFLLHYKEQALRVAVLDMYGVLVIDDTFDTSIRDNFTPTVSPTIFGGPSGKWVEGELGDILIGTTPPTIDGSFIQAMAMRSGAGSEKRKLFEQVNLYRVGRERINISEITDGEVVGGENITDALNEAVSYAGDTKLEIYVPAIDGIAEVSSGIDLKRCDIAGAGLSHDGVLGGSKIKFLAGGFYSSIPSNAGFAIQNMVIKGAATLAGQRLIDFTGQNAPQARNLSLEEVGGGTWDALANDGYGAWTDPGVCMYFKESDGGTETHYSNFQDIFMEKFDIGAYFPASTKNGGHGFTGGRVWRANPNGIGFEFEDGVGDILLSRVYLETGSTTWDITAAIRSKGYGITVLHPRSEIVRQGPATPPGLWTLPGAGEHVVIGGVWSGFQFTEHNDPDDNIVIGNIKRTGTTYQNALHGSLPKVRKVNLLHQTSTVKALALDGNGGLTFDGAAVAMADLISSAPEYADDAAAGVGGLTEGDVYVTTAGAVMRKQA